MLRAKLMRAFISYSHKDSAALERLHTHLAMLKREGKITSWYDREILAGDNIDEEIAANFKASDLFLALVSPDFLASPYCYDREMTEAMTRHNDGTMRVVPIILEPCDWKATSLQKVKAVPRDGKPVSDWTNANTAFLDIVTELRRLTTAPIPSSEPKVQASTDKTVGRRYRVKRDFDEIDRSEFRSAAFETIRNYFESAANEISGIENLRARFSVLGPTGFTCTIINKMKQRGIAHLTLHVGGGRHDFGLGDISFNHQENGPSGTSNGVFSVEADDYDLFLRGGTSFRSDKSQKLTPQQAAEVLWADLLERAGITVHD